MHVVILLSILAIANPFAHKGPRDTLADYIARARQSETAPTAPQTLGSLWAPQGRFTYIAGDYKALNVGDVITIRIVEDTNARNTGSTAANRTFDTKSGITGIAGRVNIGGVQNLFSANSASDLKGKAQAATTTTLRTSLAGRVMAVLANGSLVVQAQRDVYMNNERQKVLVR
ncbi:MAG TPA: flagellar basal body L-ring protein FlgH, partial [Candidatus Sulfotelmatobacter sp.]|nr:flagellar basal body L-ring protein FlgH [Candidatus Sulfotelmatobacter sp.]